MPTNLEPPIAKIEPKELKIHDDVRIDNYYWLKEREDQEVIDYLTAENEYTNAMTAHTNKLEDELFEEIKGRIKQTDQSVPYKSDDYYYYTRYEDGKEYPIYCRKKGSMDGKEEIMVNANEIAEGHEFCSVRGRYVSSGQNLLAFSVDTVGRRLYTLQFKNLDTGEIYEDKIANVTGNAAWANDNKTIFYTRKDLETLRSNQIYKHVLGTDPANDELIFDETDDTFSCFIFKTKSKKYLMIGSNQTLSSEYRYLDASNPNGKFKVFLKRERDHEYDVDHFKDKFYVRTNLNAKNFRLMETPITNTSKNNWKEVIPHRDDVLFNGFEIFTDHLVLSERKNGLAQLRVMPWDGSKEHYLDFGEPTYLA